MGALIVCCFVLAGLLIRAHRNLRREKASHAESLAIIVKATAIIREQTAAFLAKHEDYTDEWARAEALNEELRFYRLEDERRDLARKMAERMVLN